MLKKLFGFGKKAEKKEEVIDEVLEELEKDQTNSEEIDSKTSDSEPDKSDRADSQEASEIPAEETEEIAVKPIEEIKAESLEELATKPKEVPVEAPVEPSKEEPVEAPVEPSKEVPVEAPPVKEAPVETIEEPVGEVIKAPVEEIDSKTSDSEPDKSDRADSGEASEIPAEETEEIEERLEEENIKEDQAEAVDEEAVETEPSSEPVEKLGFFAKLKKGLTNTSKNFTSKLENLFSGYTKVDDEIFEELEELLILADLGFETATEISEELRKRSEEKKIEDVQVLEKELQSIIEEILLSATKDASDEETKENKDPVIMVIVGVNGVGKTTSIGKIAMQLKSEGKSVMLAAGDTFRAAAAEQLSIWADRAGVPIIRSNEGADPSSVIFDAIKSAKAKNIDVLICDTAGRLHNKKNLMVELEKIFRVINREYPEAQKETLLVIDATTGQNALNQAKTFSEVAPLTGIILTKLDGTAKGGVVISLSRELSIPIKYVGVGEKIDDLQKFNPGDFASALFSKN